MSGLILSEKKEGVFYRESLEEKRIFSAEELCYYLKQNIYAINEDFFGEELCAFLAALGYQSLSVRLLQKKNLGKSYLSMAADVIMEIDYYSGEEKKKILAEFDRIMERSPAQNRKVRADILMKNGKEEDAYKEYKNISEDADLEEELRADCLNDLGVICGAGFRYEEAYTYFRQAMQLHKKQEYLDNMICCLILAKDGPGRMGTEALREKEKELCVQYGVSGELIEKYGIVVEREAKNVELSGDTIEFKEKISPRNKPLEEYYQTMEELLAGWKEDFRKQGLERQK